jgi:NTE family protein
MTVDTRGTAITEFGIGPVERRELIERGKEAARDFLQRRDGRRRRPARS